MLRIIILRKRIKRIINNVVEEEVEEEEDIVENKVEDNDVKANNIKGKNKDDTRNNNVKDIKEEEIYIAPGIIKKQINIIIVCYVKNPYIPIRYVIL